MHVIILFFKLLLLRSTSALLSGARFSRSMISTRAAKGFGGEKAKPATQAKKPVSNAQESRDKASSTYKKQVLKQIFSDLAASRTFALIVETSPPQTP
jgi:hypothetical protein